MKKILNGYQIKIIAILSMLVDHIGFTLGPSILGSVGYYAMRGIGRLAFPLFAFLIVQGFIHTRRFSTYLIRILIAAVISEIPFDLMTSGKVFNPLNNNVLFSFAIALVVLWVIRKASERPSLKPILSTIAILLGSALAYFGCTDYSYKAVLVVASMYILQNQPVYMYLMICLVMFVNSTMIDFAAALAIIPMCMYNGAKGRDDKHLMYIVYPAHMFILWLVYYFLM